MRDCKIFVVGPEQGTEESPDYLLIRQGIQQVFNESRLNGDTDLRGLEIYDPRNNPGGDNFNDWIFGQIDTCNMLVADITGFNPNVIYEIALAHALGVPCQYVRFSKPDRSEQEPHADVPDQTTGQEGAQDEATSPASFALEGEGSSEMPIAHYFKFALLADADPTDLSSLTSGDFGHRMREFFKKRQAPSGNLLTQYYGGVPLVDAEFTRGLAQTYCRNFLFPLLRLPEDEKYVAKHLSIVLPDTLTKPDSLARDSLLNSIDQGQYVGLGANILKRPFRVLYEESTKTVFDLPSIAFTIGTCARFTKVNGSDLFSDIDKDRLTDAMTRKFVDEVKKELAKKLGELETLASSVSFRWLSELAGDWVDEIELLNRDPLE